MAEPRAVAFAVLAVGCAGVAAGTVSRLLHGREPAAAAGSAREAIGRGQVLSVRDGSAWAAPLDAPGAARPLGLRCDRVYFAGGRGICLLDTRARVASPAVAIVFDRRGRELRRFDLEGIPSRARVSPGGRYASATVFVAGDTYDSFLGMSTRTAVFDLERGTVTPSLEAFDVIRDGRPFRADDLNVWGVTFDGDGGRFYATVATGRDSYLVAGDLGARTLHVLRAGVECPSLSPDGRRIAYKHRLPDDRWRVHVLELGDLRDRELAAETRSVDDQMEWLDDHHILYAVHEQSFGEGEGQALAPVNTWQLAVDATTPPRLFARGASSPAVVRQAGGTP